MKKIMEKSSIQMRKIEEVLDTAINNSKPILFKKYSMEYVGKIH